MIDQISAWAVARNYETIILINLERTDGKTLKAEVLVNKTLKVIYTFALQHFFRLDTTSVLQTLITTTSHL